MEMVFYCLHKGLNLPSCRKVARQTSSTAYRDLPVSWLPPLDDTLAGSSSLLGKVVSAVYASTLSAGNCAGSAIAVGRHGGTSS
jgi:hypothetical protein